MGSESLQANRKKVVEEYGGVVTGVARVLQEAETSGEIALRASFAESIAKESVPAPVAVVTTNWDTLLDAHFKDRFPVMHLHGSVLDSSIMLLPSEIVMEVYRADSLQRIMMKRHRRILDQFESAKKVIIYGLSLDPLDAELNLIVGDSLRGDNPDRKTGPKEIVVIDRNPDEIEARLRHFDPGMNIRKVPV